MRYLGILKKKIQPCNGNYDTKKEVNLKLKGHIEIVK